MFLYEPIYITFLEENMNANLIFLSQHKARFGRSAPRKWDPRYWNFDFSVEELLSQWRYEEIDYCRHYRYS